MKKIKITLNIIVFFAVFIYFLFNWIGITYDNASFDQILFHVTEPIDGVGKTVIFNFIFEYLLLATIEYCIVLFIIKKFVKCIKTKKVMYMFSILVSILSIILIIFSLNEIGVFHYIINGKKESTFIEKEYVDPRGVNITFPKDKKNLIYIFVESLETTYFSEEEGGEQKKNLMPELMQLAQDNIYFTNTTKMGGAIQLHGTSWTTAAMIAQTSGIPLKVSKSLSNNVNIDKYMYGAYSIGEILDKEGYNQTIIFGSDGNFGNRKYYFENHGNYIVQDYYYAIKNKRIAEDYYVWWGYEDSKLFDFAKEEAINLSDKEAPFNLTLLTVNTHQNNGYLEDGCEDKHNRQYANVISCTSSQINEFIKWCKNQEFYEDTTIIVVGDHLSMDSKFFITIDDADRRIYNVFINSSVTSENTYNRQFSSFDMFPTTLASLGVKIEGNKLGLGTNLFSKELTLLEQYGYDYVNNELSYKSNFYNEKILGIKN